MQQPAEQALNDVIEALDALVIPHADDCPTCAVIRAAVLRAIDHAIVNGETGDEMRKHGASNRQVVLHWALTIDWAAELHAFVSALIQVHLEEPPRPC